MRILHTCGSKECLSPRLALQHAHCLGLKLHDFQKHLSTVTEKPSWRLQDCANSKLRAPTMLLHNGVLKVIEPTTCSVMGEHSSICLVSTGMSCRGAAAHIQLSAGHMLISCTHHDVCAAPDTQSERHEYFFLKRQANGAQVVERCCRKVYQVQDCQQC